MITDNIDPALAALEALEFSCCDQNIQHIIADDTGCSIQIDDFDLHNSHDSPPKY